ncbi:MAG: putative metal-binding motif-containing protein, partial [Myxococcota bacterium]
MLLAASPLSCGGDESGYSGDAARPARDAGRDAPAAVTDALPLPADGPVVAPGDAGLDGPGEADASPTACVEACVPTGLPEPSACFDPVAIDYQEVEAGDDALRIVTLIDPCGAAAEIVSVATSDDDRFDVEPVVAGDDGDVAAELPFALEPAAANLLTLRVTLHAPDEAATIDETLFVDTSLGTLEIPLLAEVAGPCVPTGADEVVCDGVDDDCDGAQDEDYAPVDCSVGGCAASSACVGGEELGCPPAGAAEACNDLDDDCDALVDEGCDDDFDDWCDAAMDVVGAPVACAWGGGDCDDEDFAVSPGTAETCNGADDDCDEVVDDGFALGIACDTGLPGVCQDGLTACDPGGGGDSECLSLMGAASESCNDVDDDCDGQVDGGCDDDLDGWCDGSMALSGASSVCPSGGGDCNDDNDAVSPAAAEACNGEDDDCDGESDEGGNGCGGACALAGAPGDPCDGGDDDLCEDDAFECLGENESACASGADNGDACNGLDDDCNGVADDDGSNVCGGSCALADAPGDPCDLVAAADLDACEDDLFACGDINATTCVNAGSDGDGDGWSLATAGCATRDCNDVVFTTNPGAAELC